MLLDLNPQKISLRRAMGSDIEDTCLFTHDLAMVLETLSPAQVQEMPLPAAENSEPLERSA